jgi:cytosine/adenosine deaminase-related metal-dependent hydrolase
MKPKKQTKTISETTFIARIDTYGGYINAHLHLDRANTIERKYLEHASMDPFEASSYPLKVKQDLTGELHRGLAYQAEDLEKRMRDVIEMLIKLNVKEAHSFIDTTADNVGLTAFEIALKLKKEFKDKIDLRIGAYGIFGFKDSEPERWEVFEEAARKGDYIGSLPERDDNPGHIGYDEHLRRILKLAHELEKPIHLQVDQKNDPNEDGTETLIQSVRWLGSPKIEEKLPSVWVVHSISTSAYDDKRFGKLVDGLVRYNIGVICCPSAAISMKQLRDIQAPTHNSIARVLEMLEAGVNVRLGSDNIADVFMPFGTPDLYQEVRNLADAVRFYNPDVWAKVATGTELNNMDRKFINDALNADL